MREVIISILIVGVICTLMAAILVLSRGRLIAAAEGWSRVASLSFLFAIACSLLTPEEKSKEKKED